MLNPTQESSSLLRNSFNLKRDVTPEHVLESSYQSRRFIKARVLINKARLLMLRSPEDEFNYNHFK